MDCILPRSCVHGISQARALEWIAISFSRGSSQPRDWTWVSGIVRQILYHWPTREAPSLCIQFSLVQSLSCVWLFVTPWTHSMPGLPVHHQLPQSTQTHVHCVGDAIQSSHLLSSSSLPALNLSQHQGFSKESALCIRWPKYCSFSFSISPSNAYSGLISFRMDWLDFQGTLKSLLQHNSSKSSIL